MATGHSGRDRMMKHLGTKYANNTREAVELFKSFCLVPAETKETNDQRGCCEANTKQSLALVVRWILSTCNHPPVTFQLDHCLSVPSHKVLYHTASNLEANTRSGIPAVEYISRVPTPMVDRERGIHVTSWGSSNDRGDNNLYTTAVKTGILINIHANISTYAHNAFYPSETTTKTNRYLSATHFDLCPQCLLSQ